MLKERAEETGVPLLERSFHLLNKSDICITYLMKGFQNSKSLEIQIKVE